jgi:hypothetical protein
MLLAPDLLLYNVVGASFQGWCGNSILQQVHEVLWLLVLQQTAKSPSPQQALSSVRLCA